MANFLSVRRTDIDEERLKRFTEEAEQYKSEQISNEELREAEIAQQNEELNQFFGFDGGLEDFIAMYEEDMNILAEQMKDDVLKAEDLEVETEDPFHIKLFEAEQAVFQKRKVEEQKENVSKISSSTDYVKDSSTKTSSFSSRTTGTSGYRSPTSSSTTTTSSSSSLYGNKSTTAKKEDEGPRRLNDDYGYVASKVQDVASQKVNGWREKPVETGWGGKPSWKRKFKNFFKSKKASILLKTGMLMTLQLGMAMIGKKYEFEGAGQMAMFLGMMMGVFYLTRELAEDGFDPRGFGIL